MKNPKSQQQPTSYKDFINKINQMQKNKISKPPLTERERQEPSINKIMSKKNVNFIHPTSSHTQSTSLWDKSTSKNQHSIERISSSKTKTQKQTQTKTKINTRNLLQTKSHNQSINHQHQNNNNNNNNSHNDDSSISKISKKDQQLSYHKFVTETMSILSSILKDPSPQLLNNKISYIHYLEVLKSLKLIYQNYEPFPNDLISELWSQFVSGENVGSFLIAVSAILGHYTGKQTDVDSYLRRKYQSLRFTRMELLSGTSTYQDGGCCLTESQCTFMPQISDRSRRIAESSRSKEKQNSTKKHLCMKMKIKNPSLKKIKNILPQTSTNKQKDEQKNYLNTEQSQNNYHYGYDENSFRLNTDYCIPSTVTARNRNTDKTGNKRSEILYRLGIQKSLQKLPNKTKNQIEFEKSQNQLTFKPKIHHSSKSKENLHKNQNSQGKGKCKVKGENDTISRMIRGRVEKEVKKIFCERGVTYNEKIADRMRKEKYQEIISATNVDLREQGQQQEQEQELELELELDVEKEKERQRQREYGRQFFAQQDDSELFKKYQNYTHNQSTFQTQNFAMSTEQPLMSLPLTQIFPKKPHSTIPDQDLIIDVYISEDHKEKLIIRKGQSLVEIAENFIKEHGLSEGKKEQLIELLEISLSQALAPIDELVEEEQLASARTYGGRKSYR